jgi:hypothetical protein
MNCPDERRFLSRDDARADSKLVDLINRKGIFA